MNDTYKKIQGTNDYYITSDGYVFKKTSDYAFKQIAVTQMPSGYCQSFLKDKNGKWSNKLVHLLVANAFLPKGRGRRNVEIDHKNGDKSDNRVENLQWVTHARNMELAWQNGAFKGVSKAISAKRKAMGGLQTELTVADVRQIRHLRNEGLTNVEVGFIFDLHPMQISRIYNKRSFANVV